MTAEDFVGLQRTLRAFEADGPLTVVCVPSMNLDRELVERHGAAIASLEERCHWALGALRREDVRVVLVQRSAPVGLDYHLGLLPDPAGARERLDVVCLDDAGWEPLSELLLSRPEKLEEIRRLVEGDAFILPWNVSHAEEQLALALGIPTYGVDTRFIRLRTKSGARQLFREEGVPMAAGVEDLTSIDGVVAAVAALREERPGLGAVVLKLDDSVFGEGNVVLSLKDDPGDAVVDLRVRALPPEWLDKLPEGAVAEEMLVGEEFESPSVQVRILPGGRVLVISTHDQVLGGPLGQTFVGCYFPAHPDYSAQIVAHARRVGEHLARAGAVGRFGVDFVTTRSDGAPWDARAVEINLREGGTSHPYGTLWLNAGGGFDSGSGGYRDRKGRPKAYFATDHLAHESLQDLGVDGLLAAVRGAGLGWDPDACTGVILHRLRSVADESAVALVAIAETREQADEVYLGVIEALG